MAANIAAWSANFSSAINVIYLLNNYAAGVKRRAVNCGEAQDFLWSLNAKSAVYSVEKMRLSRRVRCITLLTSLITTFLSSEWLAVTAFTMHLARQSGILLRGVMPVS